jgi:hypothetical protein
LTRNSDFESTIEEIEKQYGIGPYARKQQQEEEMVVESYNRQKTPEELFYEEKQEWFFHDSSWYWRDLPGYDGEGCVNGVCVAGCKYYIADIDEPLRIKLKMESEGKEENSRYY